MSANTAPSAFGVAADPTIAVIVPNRNDSRYIARCIRSVLEQDVPPDELIVVDDQSTDDSVSVIRSLLRDAPHAALIENQIGLGTNGALNEGLRRACSDYVLFLSSNDFVLPGIFARAKACLAHGQRPGLWSAMVSTVDEADRPIRLHPSAVIAFRDAWFSPRECLDLAYRLGNWFTGTTLILHRETVLELGGLDPAYRGLADLVTALTIACRRGVAYTPEPFGIMRVHDSGFLASTLTDIAGVEAIIDRTRERGARLEPSLFTSSFVDRLAHRFRFAAIRTMQGSGIAEFASKYTGFRRGALNVVDRWVPARLAALRIALTFLILRPFDVSPVLRYRLIGALVIRSRLWLRQMRLKYRWQQGEAVGRGAAGAPQRTHATKPRDRSVRP